MSWEEQSSVDRKGCWKITGEAGNGAGKLGKRGHVDSECAPGRRVCRNREGWLVTGS